MKKEQKPKKAVSANSERKTYEYKTLNQYEPG